LQIRIIEGKQDYHHYDYSSDQEKAISLDCPRVVKVLTLEVRFISPLCLFWHVLGCVTVFEQEDDGKEKEVSIWY
jgi:hypothetical protein